MGSTWACAWSSRSSAGWRRDQRDAFAGIRSALPGAVQDMQSTSEAVPEPLDGDQVALEDLSEITVTVTSADGSREKVYRVSFPEEAWDQARDPWPHCLRGAVSEGFSLVVFEGAASMISWPARKAGRS